MRWPNTARPTRTTCRDIEKTPDVQTAKADLVQAQQAFERAKNCSSARSSPQQALDDAQTALAVEAGELRLRAAERQEPARRHRRVEAAMKLADRQLRDTDDPRAVRRLRARSAS